MKVFVYCNSKTKSLSVKPLEGPDRGRVVASVEQIVLRDVEFRVSEAGRQRVLRDQRKNVHAGVVGIVEALWGAEIRGDPDNETMRELAINKPFRAMNMFEGNKAEIAYNPYEMDCFFRKSDKAPLRVAQRVKLDRCRAWAYKAR